MLTHFFYFDHPDLSSSTYYYTFRFSYKHSTRDISYLCTQPFHILKFYPLIQPTNASTLSKINVNTAIPKTSSPASSLLSPTCSPHPPSPLVTLNHQPPYTYIIFFSYPSTTNQHYISISIPPHYLPFNTTITNTNHHHHFVLQPSSPPTATTTTKRGILTPFYLTSPNIHSHYHRL